MRNCATIDSEDADVKKVSKLTLNTNKGKILYSEDSLRKLAQNDSLKYEHSLKAVLDEF